MVLFWFLVDFCFDDKDYFGDFFNGDEVAGDSFSCSQSSEDIFNKVCHS